MDDWIENVAFAIEIDYTLSCSRILLSAMNNDYYDQNNDYDSLTRATVSLPLQQFLE